MEIKSKKYINEGFNSKAYIINDEYILLEGVNKNSYDNYKKYSESLNKLVDVKSLQIPNIIELIAPNNEFPNGAMVYKMIKGHTFTKSYIDKVDKEQLAKKLADFMNELYEVPVIFDKKIYVEQELNNAKINLELLSANSHFLRPAGPHFPASQGHIKRSALEIGRARGAPPC